MDITRIRRLRRGWNLKPAEALFEVESGNGDWITAIRDRHGDLWRRDPDSADFCRLRDGLKAERVGTGVYYDDAEAYEIRNCRDTVGESVKDLWYPAETSDGGSLCGDDEHDSRSGARASAVSILLDRLCEAI